MFFQKKKLDISQMNEQEMAQEANKLLKKSYRLMKFESPFLMLAGIVLAGSVLPAVGAIAGITGIGFAGLLLGGIGCGVAAAYGFKKFSTASERAFAEYNRLSGKVVRQSLDNSQQQLEKLKQQAILKEELTRKFGECAVHQPIIAKARLIIKPPEAVI